jgi:hypothetical protein
MPNNDRTQPAPAAPINLTADALKDILAAAMVAAAANAPTPIPTTCAPSMPAICLDSNSSFSTDKYFADEKSKLVIGQGKWDSWLDTFLQRLGLCLLNGYIDVASRTTYIRKPAVTLQSDNNKCLSKYNCVTVLRL